MALSLTVGIYVQMAVASGDLFISKISTILGSVPINWITIIVTGELTMSKGIYASRLRSMQTREASSRVVECIIFLPLVIYIDLIHPIVIQPHAYSVDYT